MEPTSRGENGPDRVLGFLLKGLAEWSGIPALGLDAGEELAGYLEGNCSDEVLVPGPELRAAGHFDFRPDLLVFSRRIGCLGLVYILSQYEAQITDEVEDRVSQAAYLRHLMISDPQRGSSIPYSVELLLVNQAGSSIGARLGERLSEVAKSSDFLHGIGVNVLDWQPGQNTISHENLRRAFPWLLVETRHWYGLIEKPKWPTPGRVHRISLENYRLPGKRTLILDGSRRLHLMFGHNGSGKSSISESLEWLLTGGIERLSRQGVDDYLPIIRNRSNASGTVTVRAELAKDKQDDGMQVYSASNEPDDRQGFPIQPGLNAGAFRLNQRMMDRLAQEGDVERARIFSQAFFFPEEKTRLQALATAKKEVEQRLERLPHDMRQWLESEVGDREQLKKKLSVFNPKGGPVSFGQLEPILPLPAEALKSLGYLEPKLATAVGGLKGRNGITRKEIKERLNRFDTVLKSLVDRLEEIVATTRQAKEAMEAVVGWTAGEKKALGENPVPLLNEWLDRSVLGMITKRQLRLAEVFSQAKSNDWNPSDDAARNLDRHFTSFWEENSSIKDAFDAGTEERADILESLLQAVGDDTRSQAAETPEQHSVMLRPDQIEALNRVGKWLSNAWIVRTDEPEPLGDVINIAMTTGEKAEFTSYLIGVPGWAPPFLEIIESIFDALGMLEELNTPSAGLSASARYNQVSELFESLDRELAAGIELQKGFLRRIGLIVDKGETGSQINAAMNELMALFTPSRWTYQSTKLDYSVVEERGERGQALGFMTDDGARADLRFNTAELNLFTISLFLLCALRVENKLSFLILDDPLQNMDELTVTTLARGLTRLISLWSELGPWQMLVMLHGEDDMERFRREVPAAAYKLDWLGITGDITENKSTALDDGLSLGETYQPIGPYLLQIRP